MKKAVDIYNKEKPHMSNHSNFIIYNYNLLQVIVIDDEVIVFF